MTAMKAAITAASSVVRSILEDVLQVGQGELGGSAQIEDVVLILVALEILDLGRLLMNAGLLSSSLELLDSIDRSLGRLHDRSLDRLQLSRSGLERAFHTAGSLVLADESGVVGSGTGHVHRRLHRDHTLHDGCTSLAHGLVGHLDHDGLDLVGHRNLLHVVLLSHTIVPFHFDQHRASRSTYKPILLYTLRFVHAYLE